MEGQNLLNSLRSRGGASVGAILGWLATLYLAGFTRIVYKQPLSISGDHILTLVAIKEASLGLLRLNDHFGAPFKKDNFYFPLFDFSYKAIGAVFTLLTGNLFASVTALYFVGVTLMFFFCRWALRKLEVASWLATFGAAAFTICPYFGSRAVGHDFLSIYYGVALGAAIPLVISYTAREIGLKRATLSPFIVTAVIVSGLSGIYYGLFAIVFLTVGLLAVAGERQSFRPILVAGVLGLTIVALLLLSTYGTGIIDGVLTPLPKRQPWAQLYHGLFIPTAMQTYADVGIAPAKYADYANLTSQGNPLAAMSGESFWSEWPGVLLTTIILLAPIGLATTIFINRPSPHAKILTISLLLMTFGLLFGIRGGLGYVFGYFVTGALRAQQRIIPFLTFYAIVVVCVSWEMLWRRRQLWAIICAPFIAVGLLVGIYQTPRGILASKQAAFLASPSAQQNLQSVRDMLSAKNASGLQTVLQLPLTFWPESPDVGNFDPYTHQLPYLLEGLGARTRWSYGLSVRQPEWSSQKLAVAVGFPEMTKRARALGFDSLLVEATAYTPENLNKILALIRDEVGDECVLMSDSHRTLFSLTWSPNGVLCERPSLEPNRSTTFRFSTDGNLDDLLGDGWSTPEPMGRWTVGRESKFSLPVSSAKGPFTVTLDYLPFNPTNKKKSISITAGTSVIAAPGDTAEHVVTVVVQDAVNGIIPVTIKVDDPERPSAFGSADTRLLGVNLRSIKVEAAQ